MEAESILAWTQDHHLGNKTYAGLAGELTPSLKVKRKVVEAKYGRMLDGFYGDAFVQL